MDIVNVKKWVQRTSHSEIGDSVFCCFCVCIYKLSVAIDAKSITNMKDARNILLM